MPFPGARDIQLNKQSLDTLLTTQMTAKEAPRMSGWARDCSMGRLQLAEHTAS